MSNNIIQPKGVEENERELLFDSYVQKVSGRLRLLRSPSDNNKKRWIWELLQNAKDSIANSTQRHVDIMLEVLPDRIVFRHNGNPFSNKALSSLIWQMSGEKRGNSESTGRFGTGFLTTHTLSQVVKLESILIDDDNLKWGVEVILNRHGDTDEELRQGIKETLESKKYTPDPKSEWTSFTYFLRNNTNIESAKAGVASLKQNVFFNLAFTKEINSIKIVEGSETSFIQRLETQLISEQIKIFRFKQMLNEREDIVSIVMSSTDVESKELSEKFKQQRNIRIDIAIEIDEKLRQIKGINRDVPRLYCVFPLIGTEKFYFPVVVNSPDFEPIPERERLLLQGEEYDPESGIITIDGINKLLLTRAVALFEQSLQYFSVNSWSNMHFLAHGAKNMPVQEFDFDSKWYKDNIQDALRKIIVATPIVATNSGLQPIKKADGEYNIIFPKASSQKSQELIYQFTQELSPERLPTRELVNEWADLIWKEDCYFQTADVLIKQVSEFQNSDSLPLSDNIDKTKWINDLITFVEKEDSELLNEVAIIPNRKGDFKLKSFKEFSNDDNIPENALLILSKFGVDWSDILKMRGITGIEFQLTKGIDEFSVELNRIVNLRKKDNDNEFLDSILFLSQHIPTLKTEAEKEFVEKRRQILRFSNEIFGVDRQEIIQDFPQAVYESSDDWLLRKMLNEVAKKQNIENLDIISTIPKIEWLNEFIGFVKSHLSTDLFDDEKYKILPNQKGSFTLKKHLSKDENVPEQLKDTIFEDIGLKLKASLLDNEITNYRPENIVDISLVATRLNEQLVSTAISAEAKKKCILRLITLLPSESMAIQHKYQSELFNFTSLFYNELELQAESIANANENLWSTANKRIVAMIIKDLEGFTPIANEGEKELSSIGQLNTRLKNEDINNSIKWLSDFHLFLSKNEISLGTTVPNQNFNFCLMDKLFRDDEIPSELIKILWLLDKKKDFRNILCLRQMGTQPVHPKSTKDIAIEINDFIDKNYRNNANDDFKEAVRLLIIEWFNSPNYPSSALYEFKTSDKNLSANREYFKDVWTKRETIEINLLWTVDERRDMQSLKKSLPTGAIKELLANPNIVQENKALAAQNQDLSNKVNELTNILGNERVVELIKSVAPKDIPRLESALAMVKNEPTFTVERYEKLLELEEVSKGWNTDVEVYGDQRKNLENGWAGEAFVYKELKGKYKNVLWPNKSETETGNIIIGSDGEKHYIDDKMYKYDLVVEFDNGAVGYFQVKSTTTDISRADQIALPISTREWKFINETKESESYYLARVFNVTGVPELYFMKLDNLENV